MLTATAGWSSAAFAKSREHAPLFDTDTVFDVRRYGAHGDGKRLDTTAINQAITAAAEVGGGTVFFPAGSYLSYSIHLASNVALYLDHGSIIIAAPGPSEAQIANYYDIPEPQGSWSTYQDFGHNHWHNSLIWGENIHDVAILGSGRIWGRGLNRGLRLDAKLSDEDYATAEARLSIGAGNKVIALKNCHNVLLRDFAILEGGWFGILATGVDNLTIDNLNIDTNRDGIDIDCCKNVHISNCSVNTPWDDGICVKSSFALGYVRDTENVTITNCTLSGNFQIGSMLDGSFRRFDLEAEYPRPHGSPARVARVGRIKCGTESNGGFKNIAITNCVFDYCKGVALETVDGGQLEDITISGITMRGATDSPLFLRLGSRLRGPGGAPVGSLKRVMISNISSHGTHQTLPSIISGIPGHAIEDLQLNDIYVDNIGGMEDGVASLRPPEQETVYPDPKRFAPLPATGFYIRHVRNIALSNVEIVTGKKDARAEFWLDDVKGVDLFRIKSNGANTLPHFCLTDVEKFRLSGSYGVADRVVDRTEADEF